jgi:hypothetical protein
VKTFRPEGETMTLNLVFATLFALSGALETLVQKVATWMTAAFLLVADVWVIVVIIGCTVIIIIVIVIRTSRRQ